MNIVVAPIALVLSVAIFIPISADDDGWNESGIEWTSAETTRDHRGVANEVSAWDAALEKASKEKKPLMLLIHRTWCGACKKLR